MHVKDLIHSFINEGVGKMLRLIQRAVEDLGSYRQFNKRMLGYDCWIPKKLVNILLGNNHDLWDYLFHITDIICIFTGQKSVSFIVTSLSLGPLISR